MALPWPFGRGPRLGKARKEEKMAQLEEFGVTQQLLDFLKDFTVDTFKNFPLKDDASADGDVGSSGSSLSNDLSEWQERHALLLLTEATEISRIRYALCPRFLKDKQFWRIYFRLVKNYVAPYEKRAIQKDLIKKHLENEKLSDKAAVEVEMMESKLSCNPKAVLRASESGGEGIDESPHGNLPSVCENNKR